MAVYNVAQASQLADTQTREASFFGDKILICTEGGFKWVSRKDLDKEIDTDQPHTPQDQYECGLCYLAAHGLSSALIPAVVSVPLAPLKTVKHAVKFGQEILIAQTINGFRSRAPPLFS